MKIPKEFNLIWAQIDNRRKLYFGMGAAILSSVMVAFVPYIYGRLVDVAINRSNRRNENLPNGRWKINCSS